MYWLFSEQSLPGQLQAAVWEAWWKLMTDWPQRTCSGPTQDCTWRGALRDTEEPWAGSAALGADCLLIRVPALRSGVGARMSL